MIIKYPCSSPAAARNYLLYNTSCLSTVSVELYQGLTFTAFPSKITPSISSPVTQSSVTAVHSLSKSLLYLIDFGDGTSNKTWREGSILRHHYITPGEFNITFVASRGNSTVFMLSRKIRVSFLRVSSTWCPHVEPLTDFYCRAYKFGGSGVTALMSLGNLNQTVSISIPGMTRNGLHDKIQYETQLSSLNTRVWDQISVANIAIRSNWLIFLKYCIASFTKFPKAETNFESHVGSMSGTLFKGKKQRKR